MDREDQRQALLDRDQGVDQFRQLAAIVDIGGTVKGDDAIATRLKAELARHRRRLDLRPHQLEAVEHDVADPGDPLGRNAFGEQILVSIGRRRPENVGDDVRDEAVDLLGHRSVAASKAGFEMNDRDAELGADHRSGDGRVDVSDNDQPVGPVLQRHFLIGDHYPGGLFGMAAGAHPQLMYRRLQLEVPQYVVGHIGVVMLTGMDQYGFESASCGKRVPQRCHLHEIRPGRGDQMDSGRWHVCILQRKVSS